MSLVIVIVIVSIILFSILFRCAFMNTRKKKIMFKNYSDIYYYSQEDPLINKKKMKIKTKF
jgi:hypothetical protein